MLLSKTIALVATASLAFGQYNAGGPTQPGLPDGCVGSFPDIPSCQKYGWSLPGSDPCAPPGPYPVAGQQVYIKDDQNFCINLPNPDSIVLQNNYYNAGKLPTIVQAEGYVRSFCMGDYLPPGSLKLPNGGVRSAHVTVYSSYIQIHGYLDCGRLNINCTQSYPDAFDDGGQYDNGAWVHCGKEPYSGVDTSANGNPGFENYVEQAGDGIFCMRVCKPGTLTVGGVCDVTQDTKGCQAFMGVTFSDGFSYTNTLTGESRTDTVSLPPPWTPTPSPTTAAPSPTGDANSNGNAAAVATSATSGDNAVTTNAAPKIQPSGGIITSISTALFGVFALIIA